MITQFVIIALVLFFAFRLTYFVHTALPYSKRIKYHARYVLPVIELFSWIGFAVWSIDYIYQSENFQGLVFVSILFVILAVPAYFLLRDFIFGIYLKIQRKIDAGDFIEFDNIEGEIVRAGHCSIEIRDTEGDINTIPYSKIRSTIIIKHGANPNLKKQILVFKFPDHISINAIRPELEKHLLNAPWVAVSQPPFIEKVKQEDGNHIFEVAVFTLKNEYAEYIREIVEKNFSPA